MAYSLVVWIDEDTSVPSVIGPYESEKAFEAADEIRLSAHKVQVCISTTVEEWNKLLKLMV